MCEKISESGPLHSIVVYLPGELPVSLTSLPEHPITATSVDRSTDRITMAILDAERRLVTGSRLAGAGTFLLTILGARCRFAC